MSEETNGFALTVDWCNEGRRGLFVSRDMNVVMWHEKPTDDEIWQCLGAFELILAPQVIEIEDAALLNDYVSWTPLKEYSSAFGIARKAEQKQSNCHIEVV